MFNSARPTKEDAEKQKRALEDMHQAHLQQQAAKQGSSDQPTGIDAVIASWQKSLTETAGSAAASGLVGSPDSPAPSPLFGPPVEKKKKKDEGKKGHHHHHKDKKKDDDALLIRLSVPSDDTCEKASAAAPAEQQPQQEEGKLVILDDYDNGKSAKKSHSRHNSTTPPAPADSAEAAGDLGSGLSALLIPPLHGATSTSVSSPSSPSPSSATATSTTPPAVSAPAGVTSPQQQQQQGGYGQPSQFIPPVYSSGPPQQQQQGGYGGSGPAPGSFHPPPYQNVTPYGLPPQQQQQQQQQPYGYGGGGYGYPPQGYPMYPPQQQQHQQSSPMMGYPSPQAPLQPQMNAPMGYNQRPMGNPLGLSAPPYGQGPMMMGIPRPVSAPEVLADQLSNLDIAKHSYQMQPPPHAAAAAGLMQPLVPVAAPMISSPDNSAGGSGAASDGDDEWHIDYSELETTKEIARGSFGVVYQGAFRGTEVAVKKLIQQHFSPEQMKDFLDEINMMKKLHHPNVVLLIGVCVKEPNLCIVTELLAGSMWNLLHDKNVRLEWKLQHKLLLDTAKGMNYLHLFKPPIIHRDLKSPNLLVDSHFNVKIADFGLARIKAQLMTGNLGTCQYMAPEVITSATYSEKADVYSYGVVIWEVLTRQAPWQGMQPMQIAYGVVHQSMRPQIPPGTAPPLTHLMQQCWHQDPLQRPSFTEILQQLKALPI